MGWILSHLSTPASTSASLGAGSGSVRRDFIASMLRDSGAGLKGGWDRREIGQPLLQDKG